MKSDPNLPPLDERDQRTLEELMAHIILAGGRRFEPEELAAIPLGRAMQQFTPNGIRFKVINAEVGGRAD